MNACRYYIPQHETLPQTELEHIQREKLSAMLAHVLHGNAFYRRKLAGVNFNALHDPLEKLPFTTRGELEADQAANPPYGSNLSQPLDRYCRMHQTSGTGGRPLRWLDTQQNWDWWKRCWGIIFTAAGIARGDRVFFPFSFGPFVGFWGAFEGAVALGNLALPGGAMGTLARLHFMLDNQANFVCCTPTYALRMAEVAKAENIDLASSPVRCLVVAGEPGGSIPQTRQQIEAAWGARVLDHTGMTEIGPLGFECLENPTGVHLSETECIAEILDPQTDRPVADGEIGELIITNLGRWDSPVIRYRTGDLVRPTRALCACGRWMTHLQGGILGRRDDMFIVRGNNVFPSAIENILRGFGEIAEFAIEVQQNGSLPRIQLKLEPQPLAAKDGLVERVGRAVHERLAFRADITLVDSGSLPRFELKSHRFVRRD